MASSDADICNLALLRIGERKQVTSPISSDASTNGQICNLVYANALNGLLSRFPWRFATSSAWLYEEGIFVLDLNAPVYPEPGWLYTYILPSDVLEARYIFSGARPAQPAVPIIPTDPVGITQVSMLPALNGAAPQIPFEVRPSSTGSQSYLFSDFTDTSGPPDWESSSTYPQYAVVNYNGDSFVSLQSANTNNTPDPTQDTEWWANTNTAQLVYTQKVSTVASMPQLFVDALTWQVAVDLALAIATKPQLAAAIQKAADEALKRAVAAESNARQPDIRPMSSFIAVRG